MTDSKYSTRFVTSSLDLLMCSFACSAICFIWWDSCRSHIQADPSIKILQWQNTRTKHNTRTVTSSFDSLMCSFACSAICSIWWDSCKNHIQTYPSIQILQWQNTTQEQTQHKNWPLVSILWCALLHALPSVASDETSVKFTKWSNHTEACNDK